jgi:hypothetical protein
VYNNELCSFSGLGAGRPNFGLRELNCFLDSAQQLLLSISSCPLQSTLKRLFLKDLLLLVLDRGLTQKLFVSLFFRLDVVDSLLELVLSAELCKHHLVRQYLLGLRFLSFQLFEDFGLLIFVQIQTSNFLLTLYFFLVL